MAIFLWDRETVVEHTVSARWPRRWRSASLKSQQINLHPSAWLDTIRDKREHMFLRDPTRSDQSQHICPSFFPTPAIHLQPSTSSHFFFFSSRLSSPSSPSPPVVSPLGSMLYSLGPSLGAAHSVHVPGMADRPDPFTRRFSSPSSSFTPSLAPLPSTPLCICMRLYPPRTFGMYVCSIRLSVSFSLSPCFSL